MEVRSPDDREPDIEEKIDVYLRGGPRLVLLADPSTRTLTALDAEQRALFRAPEIFTHAAFPGLRIDVAALFAALDDV